MYYHRRASPKHRYNIIEDYGGRGHRTRLRDQEINCCVYGVPPGHVYKGMEEWERAGPYGAPWRSPTPTGSRIPPFPSWNSIREGEIGEREGRGGVAPPLLVLFGLGVEGRVAQPWSPLLSSTKAH